MPNSERDLHWSDLIREPSASHEVIRSDCLSKRECLEVGCLQYDRLLQGRRLGSNLAELTRDCREQCSYFDSEASLAEEFLEKIKTTIKKGRRNADVLRRLKTLRASLTDDHMYEQNKIIGRYMNDHPILKRGGKSKKRI